jgi:probable F420-dependent oxidoreductase
VHWGISSATGGAFARPELARLLAVGAEEAGVESLWGGEHPVVPATSTSQFPLARDGKYRLGERDLPDPLIWLAHVAAVTTRIRLGTAAIVLPLRNPVLLAKEAASLDVLAGGRLLLGIGVGWLREEFEALGVEYDERGSRTEEYVLAMRALWREHTASFSGRFAHFDEVLSFPKPVGPEGVPIVVCGHSRAASRRAGRIGDGFFPLLVGEDARELLPPLITEMRQSAAGAGRDPDAVEITAFFADAAGPPAWYEECGVTRLLVRVRGETASALREDLDRVAGLVARSSS